MKELTLNGKATKRAQVLNGIMDHRWTGRQGAELLGVSERHLWRMLAAYRVEGPAALPHGNQGLRPRNATPEETRREVIALAKGTYAGVNDCQLAELLLEREGLRVPRSTLQRLLRQEGIRTPLHRRPPRHRSRRERYPQEGMLLQIDGSPHTWLEDRGPRLTLVGAIDDATGTVPSALFREQEDTQGYLLLLEGILKGKGVPVALYSDRHSIFVRSTRDAETLEEQLAGRRQPTQFGDVLDRLGIRLVLAQSPQAKGRVERLWGTLQSRLVSELRLAGARTIQEANRVLRDFLPRFNAHFGVPPAEAHTAYRPATGIDLAGTVCFHYRRKVAKDNTLVWRDRVLQVPPGNDRSSYAKAVVEVQERLDGQVVVLYKGTPLLTQAAPVNAAKLRSLWNRGLDLNDELGGQVGLRGGAILEGWQAQGTSGRAGGLAAEDRHVPVAKSKAHKPKAGHPWLGLPPLTKSVSS